MTAVKMAGFFISGCARLSLSHILPRRHHHHHHHQLRPSAGWCQSSRDAFTGLWGTGLQLVWFVFTETKKHLWTEIAHEANYLSFKICCTCV